MSDSLWLSSANFPKCQEVVSVFSCQEEAEDESASRLHFENMMIILYYDALQLQQGKRSSAAFFFWDLSGSGSVKEICRLQTI